MKSNAEQVWFPWPAKGDHQVVPVKPRLNSHFQRLRVEWVDVHRDPGNMRPNLFEQPPGGPTVGHDEQCCKELLLMPQTACLALGTRQRSHCVT